MFTFSRWYQCDKNVYVLRVRKSVGFSIVNQSQIGRIPQKVPGSLCLAFSFIACFSDTCWGRSGNSIIQMPGSPHVNFPISLTALKALFLLVWRPLVFLPNQASSSKTCELSLSLNKCFKNILTCWHVGFFSFSDLSRTPTMQILYLLDRSSKPSDLSLRTCRSLMWKPIYLAISTVSILTGRNVVLHFLNSLHQGVQIPYSLHLIHCIFNA